MPKKSSKYGGLLNNNLQTFLATFLADKMMGNGFPIDQTGNTIRLGTPKTVVKKMGGSVKFNRYISDNLKRINKQHIRPIRIKQIVLNRAKEDILKKLKAGLPLKTMPMVNTTKAELKQGGILPLIPLAIAFGPAIINAIASIVTTAINKNKGKGGSLTSTVLKTITSGIADKLVPQGIRLPVKLLKAIVTSFMSKQGRGINKMQPFIPIFPKN